jgi:hypothetical protein
MASRQVVALLVLGLLHSAPAAADEPAPEPAVPKHVSLRWNAPDTCPDDAALVGAVAGLLGQPLSETREQDLAVSVNVQGGADLFSAKLVFTSPQGAQERFLDHPDCSKLMEAVAMLAALAIDPERVRARQAAAEAEKSAPPVETPPAPEIKPAPALATQACPAAAPVAALPPKKPTRRVALAVAGFAGVGVLPGFQPGLAAELGASFERFHVGVLGRYWLPGTSDIRGGPLSIELALASAGVQGCFVPQRADWSVLGCLGLQAGDMSGSGQGLNHAHTRHAFFGALEVNALVSYARLEPAPFVGIGLSWALARPAFGATLEGVETETFRSAEAAVLAQLGLSYGL